MHCLFLMCVFAVPQSTLPTYTDARAESIRSGKPCVVGVRCQVPVGDWTQARKQDWPWGDSKFIVVSLPKNGELYHVADLPANATAGDIRIVIERSRRVSTQTIPTLPLANC